MIRYITLALICLSGGIVHAQIFIQPCDPCDLTPLEDNQVMTGKQCSLKVYSDANDLWSGGLFLSGQNRQIGVLQGRNKDPNSRDWMGSHSEHAGPMAKVYAWSDSNISGFDFYTSEYDQREGTWFVIDYQALHAGICTINYYNHSSDDWTQADPNISIVIENIPNVDFYVDNVVDMKDFMILASYWLQECADPDWCGQTDIDRDGIVDVNDITLFASCWLWGVPQNPAAPPAPDPSETPVEPNEPQSPAEPNEPQSPVDPNVIYSIHDVDGLDEIVLETGESLRLYISQETLGIDMNSFYLEAFISNPYFGGIHNTQYDPNDPNSPETAEILAHPRDSYFDYYGPGYIQYEGIQFMAVSFWEPIEDGPVASFVYTATQPGDVVIMLGNYDAVPSRLEPMIIHQVKPGQGYSAGDPNDMVEFLENLWNTCPEVQSSNSWAQWQVFLEEVRSSLSN